MPFGGRVVPLVIRFRRAPQKSKSASIFYIPNSLSCLEGFIPTVAALFSLSFGREIFRVWLEKYPCPVQNGPREKGHYYFFVSEDSDKSQESDARRHVSFRRVQERIFLWRFRNSIILVAKGSRDSRGDMILWLKLGGSF